MAKILIPTPLRKFTAAQSAVELPAANVQEAIRTLIDAHPELGRHLLDDQQQIRSFVRIYVGDTDYRDLQGADTPLEIGAVVSIVPAIAGGIL